MAAAIFIEQDSGTWNGQLHRFKGYGSDFGLPRDESRWTGAVNAPQSADSGRPDLARPVGLK